MRCESVFETAWYLDNWYWRACTKYEAEITTHICIRCVPYFIIETVRLNVRHIQCLYVLRNYCNNLQKDQHQSFCKMYNTGLIAIYFLCHCIFDIRTHAIFVVKLIYNRRCFCANFSVTSYPWSMFIIT